MLRLLRVPALPLLALISGCASTAFDGRIYRDSEMAFQVGRPPAAWRAIEAEGTRLAFRDDVGQITVAVGGRCGRDGDDVPLTALTQHLFLQFSDRAPSEQVEVSLDGRAALRSTLAATLDGVPKTFVVYVLKKDNCVYDFVWIKNQASPASPAAFDSFVRGFRTLPPP